MHGEDTPFVLLENIVSNILGLLCHLKEPRLILQFLKGVKGECSL